VFGGSTAFGYGLPDDQTVGSYLQRLASRQLGRADIKVYNFGRGHYYSTQERILFETLVSKGLVPNLAIFIDGFNDFVFTEDEPAYTQLLRDIMAKENTMSLMPFRPCSLSPLNRGWRYLRAKLNMDGTGHRNISVQPIRVQARRVADRYVRNKQMIEAAAGAFGAKTAFVWQPVPDYKYDLKSHLFYSGDGSPPNPTRNEGYRIMFKLTQGEILGRNFLWCGDIQENLKKPLYVDAYHYGQELSECLAKLIVELLSDRCLY